MDSVIVFPSLPSVLYGEKLEMAESFPAGWLELHINFQASLTMWLLSVRCIGYW